MRSMRWLPEGIGLEEAGVKTDRGYIVTDANFRTSVEGVYAIGVAIDMVSRDLNRKIAEELGHIEAAQAADIASEIYKDGGNARALGGGGASVSRAM